jgi:hypothetical protein
MRKTSRIQSNNRVILAQNRYKCFEKKIEKLARSVTNVMKNYRNYKYTVKLCFIGEKKGWVTLLSSIPRYFPFPPIIYGEEERKGIIFHIIP